MNLETYISKLKHYNTDYDLTDIIKAFNYGEELHRGQKRKSGEDFFSHPVEVSLILAELKMDEETIIAALLHDVVEDTIVTKEEIEKNFGPSIALLVDGVTKLGKIHYESKEAQKGENLRKMFLAMAKDIRVILIKLADRLHNMRTLNFMPENKKEEKATETLEIYAPIANRLGISRIKWELEDISLQYIDPEGYYDLVDKVNKKRANREKIINENIQFLKERIQEQLDIDFEIYGRAKHFYSIYKKMKERNKSFDEIFDLTAIRVIVNNVKECYSVLGICHTIWKPIAGRFKDYIAMPKSNMYQSLHTSVMGNNGETLEIQIRTHEMHRIAEYGIAAHWKYKEGKVETDEEINEKLSWIRQIMEWQKDLKDPEQFMDSLKIDLYVNEVFVFTPEGDVIELPTGSTPIDFAYKIHSEVGHQCVGAKVNGKIVPLNYELGTGEIVEIITRKNSGPSRDWLNIVKGNTAKNKIKRWFKKERREENIEKGKSMFESEVKRSGLTLKEALNPKWINPILDRLSIDDVTSMYESIGYGGILLKQVVPKLKEKKKYEQVDKKKRVKSIISKKKKKQKKTSPKGVKVKGIDNALTRFAKCCSPVPGDDIIGYITKGRGVTIHRVDCPNLKDLEKNKERFIEVDWDIKDKSESYETKIQITANDRKGLLSDITILINNENFIVNGLNAKKETDNIAIINIKIEIYDKKHLSKLVTKLKKIDDIIEVERITS